MKVFELIEALKKLPQDAEVVKECYDGCFDIYYEVDPKYKEQGDYPNQETNVVVL